MGVEGAAVGAARGLQQLGQYKLDHQAPLGGAAHHSPKTGSQARDVGLVKGPAVNSAPELQTGAVRTGNQKYPSIQDRIST